mgnify:CR=1 FL=1
MTDFMQAWQISEKDFPRNGPSAEKLAFCVRYAVLAPSVYNTQPWHFSIDGNTLYLFADRRHALPVIDPDDRQQNMTCGAALYNLRLAIRYFGYEETTELLPDPVNDSLLARVKLGEKREGTAEEGLESLFKAIPKRHSNRGAFADKDVPDDILRKLQAAAASEGAWLHICPPVERKIVVGMIAEADRIQASNKHFRRELASWVDCRRRDSGDGMPGMGLSYHDVVKNLNPSPARRFSVDNKTATDEQLDSNSPVLAVLGSKAGGVLERMRSGQGLMRVLLQAEACGLAVSALNQPCEVPELRLVMHDEISQQGRAQMILRIGYGGKATYTPRRALSEVLDFEGKSVSKNRKAANDGGQGLLGRVKGLFGK